MMSYKDRIIAFPLFNTCYPQNLARNLARFLKGEAVSYEFPILVFVMIVLLLSLKRQTITLFELKSYKVIEVIKMLKDDKWYLVAQKDSHRQFKHSVKQGKVSINGKPSDTLSQFLLNNIFKQAGWK
jgi:predicted RNA binding protein YcfA (HicA-like mRNA interferase family)